jgi:FAD/FMN-containing dehydrogenase
VAESPEEKAQAQKICQASSVILGHSEGGLRALPIIEDGIVPPERLREYLEGIYEIFDKDHLQAAIWGHAGDGSLHVQPCLDINEVGDRQKIFRIMDEYYSLVTKLGGSITTENGEGRLRAPYLQKMYGPEIYTLFQRLKQIFDPYGTLNPGVKVGTTLDDIKPMLRKEFSLDHLHGHLPKS